MINAVYHLKNDGKLWDGFMGSEFGQFKKSHTLSYTFKSQNGTMELRGLLGKWNNRFRNLLSLFGWSQALRIHGSNNKASSFLVINCTSPSRLVSELWFAWVGKMAHVLAHILTCPLLSAKLLTSACKAWLRGAFNQQLWIRVGSAQENRPQGEPQGAPNNMTLLVMSSSGLPSLKQCLESDLPRLVPPERAVPDPVLVD